LYKIGQGHILQQFGDHSNLHKGIFFLEKSILAGYRRGIPLLCLFKLKILFGLDKTKHQLFLISKHMRDNGNLDGQAYYGVCLFIGIGTRRKQVKGMYYIDHSGSGCSQVGEYFQKYLHDQNHPVWYSILDGGITKPVYGWKGPTSFSF
jgi:hypothetical protein